MSHRSVYTCLCVKVTGLSHCECSVVLSLPSKVGCIVMAFDVFIAISYYPLFAHPNANIRSHFCLCAQAVGSLL